MKIVDINLTPVAYPAPTTLRWGRLAIDTLGGILIQVLTDEGIVGLGELQGPYTEAQAAVERDILPRLRGENPLQIERLWEMLRRMGQAWPRQLLGGIDVALWDILGQVTGQPIYRLLGGSPDPVQVYIAPSMKQPEVVAEECVLFRAEGYRAIKLRIGLGQVGLAPAGDLQKDLQVVARARKVLGDDFTIGVDTDRTYDRAQALEMAPRLRELGVAWYEEPLLTSEREAYVREMRYLKSRVGVPLSGGQNLHTRFEFKELISERAVDIVQPDCARCGGITELRRIAELASTWGLTCMPHIGCGCGYDVRVISTLHVLASVSNGMALCYPAYDTPLRTELLVEPPAVVDGWLAPPQEPGLGIALDPEAVERYRVAV